MATGGDVRVDVGPTFAVMRDVANERVRQLLKGYTLDHDDAHELRDFRDFIRARVRPDTPAQERGDERRDVRQELVEVAALAVACVELIDRRAH